MAGKPNTAEQVAACELKLRDVNDAIAGLRQERRQALLDCADQGKPVEAKEIDEQLRKLEIESDGLRDLLQALEQRAEQERSAKAQKAREGLIGRVEALFEDRTANAKALEKAIGQVVSLAEKRTEIDKAIISVWAWNTSDRAAHQPTRD